MLLLVLLKGLLHSQILGSLHVMPTDITRTSVVEHELFEFFWQETLLDHTVVGKSAGIAPKA